MTGQIEQHPKWPRQVELEREMQGRGEKRYRQSVLDAIEDDEESRTKYGQLLLRETIVPFAQVVYDYVRSEIGQSRRPSIAASLLYNHGVWPKVAAFLTLKTAFNGLAKQYSLQRIAVQVGSTIETEVRFAYYEDQKPAFYDKIITNQKERGRPLHHIKRVVIAKMRKDGVEWSRWSEPDRLHLGMMLINLYLRSAKEPIFERYQTLGRKKKSGVYKLRSTPAIDKWIDHTNAMNEALTPAYMPCVIPPKQWHSVWGGGFFTLAKKLTLVKSKNQNYLNDLKHEDMPVVYGAVNALQNTAWRINQRVLDVLVSVWDGRMELGKLAPRDDRLFPDPPSDIETNEESKKKYLYARSLIHDYNHRIVSKRIQVGMTLHTASKLRAEDALYFPYQMDFRGRVYSVSEFLSPQGPDYSKALLTFAEGKPINDQTAADWLAIHGANLYGEDKCTLEDRSAWVEQNEETILQVASDPLTFTQWHDADKPWQFLAFCFEWAEFKRQGWGYPSSLPVALDGTCNGLQHFSAMLRDPVGGEATNLVPMEKPQDIYQRVADVTIEKLRRVVAEDKTAAPEAVLAEKWLAYGITRKTTKRPVMVLPYGGTLYACRKYVLAHVDEREQAGEPHPFGTGLNEACDYLAKIIWLSISDVVVAAKQAMKWLQKVARIAAKEGVPMIWRTPTGFQVRQFYCEEKLHEIKTRINGEIHRVRLREETDKLDADRQVQGISPNFVHSLDAAALMETVVDARDLGITSFSMVHDSYGTTAADTQMLILILRTVFIRIYEKHDVLTELFDEVSAMVKAPADLPAVPAKGSLNITDVLKSEFFFA